MSHDDPVRALLKGLAPPVVPPELEARTLAGAGRELRQQRAPDTWERAWASRPLRLAWAAAVLALLAGHVVLSLRPDHAGAPGASTAGREPLPAELATVAELPPIVLSNNVFESAGGPAAAPASQPAGRTEEVRR